MYRLIVLLLMFLDPSVAHGLEKTTALACVNRGITAFMAGGPIDHLVDIPFLMDREDIKASTAEVADLLNARARENQHYYRNPEVVVVGSPQAKRDGYHLVAGRVRGEARDTLDAPWKPFQYDYILWVRETEHGCQIGVLAIEEVFRLASWVKQNL